MSWKSVPVSSSLAAHLVDILRTLTAKEQLRMEVSRKPRMSRIHPWAYILALVLLFAPVDLRAGSSEPGEAEATAESDPAGTGSSAPQSASSGSSDTWQLMVAPYLFLAGMNGDVGLGGLSTDVDVSVGALLERLEFAIASRFEVRKGPWAGLFDVNFMALGDQTDLPLGGQVDVDIDMLIFESALSYRIGSGPTRTEVFGGIRYVRQDLKAAIVGGITPGLQRNSVPDWVDPIIGVRVTHPISPRASFLARGDIGGFGAGSDFSWNIEAGAEFSLTRRLGLQVFFKTLGIDYQQGSGSSFYKYDVVTPGVVIGLPIRFP